MIYPEHNTIVPPESKPSRFTPIDIVVGLCALVILTLLAIKAFNALAFDPPLEIADAVTQSDRHSDDYSRAGEEAVAANMAFAAIVADLEDRGYVVTTDGYPEKITTIAKYGDLTVVFERSAR